MNTGAHSGEYTQFVHGSRYDSACKIFLECEKIELMLTFTQTHTLLNLHFTSNILTFCDAFDPRYILQNLELVSLVLIFRDAFDSKHPPRKLHLAPCMSTFRDAFDPEQKLQNHQLTSFVLASHDTVPPNAHTAITFNSPQVS